MAHVSTAATDFLDSLTDCNYFLNGHCKFGKTCRQRHSFEATKQLGICSNWPELCRQVQCPFQHPAFLLGPKAAAFNSSKGSFIGIFWDIENVPIPRGQQPFDIVQRIRQKLVVEPGLQQADFSCYCNTNTISRKNQESLQHAGVRLVHVAGRKPGASDRQIMLDLDRFERIHRPPATIVLISGDIDFVGKLSDLRYHVGFHIIVIHNKPAKEELKATVNEHYPWTLFTNEQITPSPRRPHSNTDNRSPRSTPRAKSDRAQPRRLTSESRNDANYVDRNSPKPLISPSSTLGLNQDSFLVYYCNPNDIAPPYPFPAGTLPTTPVHYPNTNSNVETSNNVQPRPMRQSDNRANRSRRKERNTFGECVFCDAQFRTISALRQHQEDTGHLFECSMCDQGFFTHEGQRQHAKAKGHYLDEDTDISEISSGTSNENPDLGITIVRGFAELMRDVFK